MVFLSFKLFVELPEKFDKGKEEGNAKTGGRPAKNMFIIPAALYFRKESTTTVLPSQLHPRTQDPKPELFPRVPDLELCLPPPMLIHMNIQSQQRFAQHAIGDMPRHRIHRSRQPIQPKWAVFQSRVFDSQTVRADRDIKDPTGAEADDMIFRGRGGDVKDLLIRADYDGTYVPGIDWETWREGDVGAGLGCTKYEWIWDAITLLWRCHAEVC